MLPHTGYEITLLIIEGVILCIECSSHDPSLSRESRVENARYWTEPEIPPTAIAPTYYRDC